MRRVYIVSLTGYGIRVLRLIISPIPSSILLSMSNLIRIAFRQKVFDPLILVFKRRRRVPILFIT
ncbi:hypothetical protein TNCV_2306341 [Trichonephila clavipes]|nr:hypothetical protein TNCV_2306341 [Trichonephila clavipes]